MTMRTPSGAALLKPENLVTYERGGGARTTPLVNGELGTSSFITGYTSFDPGVEIPFHSHNCQESVVLMEGEAMLDIDGLEYQLKAHDVTFIPPNVNHRFRNLSKTNPMKILWIYANTEATRTLTESGATAPVSAEHVKR
ncbi:cupin domain-containing protein [Paraburkholderia sp. Tr-20389]|uniref:cupin domain-containing protein n=1 Tax=Paraburkholderia sp. Tr-20389 TaxID=2703903 RepID=UPI00197E8453|nr:cupin domain-containing protein [Paraburkholderia sp. Tr-20389]MBN3754756.1 cupin domain-containing protein [Paraburkholderia sp. Tr-20389]